jgi:hypothetical protein
MDLDEFNYKLNSYIKRNPHVRKGQAAYNVLFELFPTEVGVLTGTDIDPYYDDRKIALFVTRLGIV